MIDQDVIALEDSRQLPSYKKLPIVLTKGEGPYVWDAAGRKYLDFYGGHCVSLLGHCPPAVVEAVTAQASRLMFYSNLVYSPVRAEAASLLCSMAPPHIAQVYFCNSGTEANETALKIARKATGKSRVLSMMGGFHGRTLGSLGVTWGESYRVGHESVLAPTTFVPFGDLGAAAEAFSIGDDVAAVIVEPIQSMAGIQVADDDYFAALRTLCDRSGAMLIFDEIQTGVGRTGTFSISEQIGVAPDLITMAKSLGSGIPVGAVLASASVAETVKTGDHGSTFGGGMIAMAAVAATLKTLRTNGLMANARTVFDTVRGALSPSVRDVRGAGCLIGIETDVPSNEVVPKLREAGLLVGSSGHPHTIRLMPPINIREAELREGLEIMLETLAQIEVAA